MAEHGGVGWNGVEARNDEPPCSECAWEERAELNIKYMRIKYKLDEKINHVGDIIKCDEHGGKH